MTSDFLKECLARGNEGRPVWLPDVREVSGELADSVRIILSLDNGQRIDREIYLPRPHDAGERGFVREYLCDCVFNMLSALGGRTMCFYLPKEEAELRELIAELDGIFMLSGGQRQGYGKCVSVSERINASLGFGALRFELRDISEYAPAAQDAGTADGALASRLIQAEQRAMCGAYCGVDVGGTDIKLVGALDGELVHVREYDWDPSKFGTAEQIIQPILELIKEYREKIGGRALDGIGMSFPDVVINDMIVGGETPKTKGMRENPEIEYETEFKKLTDLKARLSAECREGGAVRIINDGSMTAFTAAAELAAGGQGEKLGDGIFAVSLGTDLGSGILTREGDIPPIPLELYDFQLDLGSRPQREMSPEDIRSVTNENSGLPGVRRYLGQAAAYRMAMDMRPELLDGFIDAGEIIKIKTAPRDMRKPCLEHLMACADKGDETAQRIFTEIGRNLGVVSREAEFVLGELPKEYYVFGRFVKHQRCFELIKAGFEQMKPDTALTAADEHMSFSPLMRELQAWPEVTVAQFAQAVGAIYLALMND